MEKEYKHSLLEERYEHDPTNYPRLYDQKFKLNVFVLGGVLWGLFSIMNFFS